MPFTMPFEFDLWAGIDVFLWSFGAMIMLYVLIDTGRLIRRWWEEREDTDE